MIRNIVFVHLCTFQKKKNEKRESEEEKGKKKAQISTQQNINFFALA